MVPSTSISALAKLVLGVMIPSSALPLLAQAKPPASQRVRTVITAPLPPHMNGNTLRATVIAVHYGPGDASPPHTHGCPVIVYVLEGKLRSRIAGQPEITYSAGESFYEAPGGLHCVSANASDRSPARFLAFFLCDRDVPLSSDPPHLHSGVTR